MSTRLVHRGRNSGIFSRVRLAKKVRMLRSLRMYAITGSRYSVRHSPAQPNKLPRRFATSPVASRERLQDRVALQSGLVNRYDFPSPREAPLGPSRRPTTAAGDPAPPP